MIELCLFDSLGGADHGWLNARDRFSFASHSDQARACAREGALARKDSRFQPLRWKQD